MGRCIVCGRVDTNEIILGLVALVLIIFSLVVSIVVPRRDAGFPGRSLRTFVLIAALLSAGVLASVEVLGEAHEGAHAEAGEVATGEEGQQSTEPVPETVTGAAEGEGEGAATTGAAEEPAGDPAAGQQVFQDAGCVACHTLAAAGATGTVGPSLDETKPPYDLVIDRVTNGMGAMPAFRDQLTEQQIQDVATFVVASTTG
jgi:mono/diheme cytochrome c family protein